MKKLLSNKMIVVTHFSTFFFIGMVVTLFIYIQTPNFYKNIIKQYYTNDTFRKHKMINPNVVYI